MFRYYSSNLLDVITRLKKESRYPNRGDSSTCLRCLVYEKFDSMARQLVPNKCPVREHASALTECDLEVDL